MHSTHSDQLLFWEVQTGKELLNIEGKKDDNISGYELAVSPDFQILQLPDDGDFIEDDQEITKLLALW